MNTDNQPDKPAEKSESDCGGTIVAHQEPSFGIAHPGEFVGKAEKKVTSSAEGAD